MRMRRNTRWLWWGLGVVFLFMVGLGLPRIWSSSLDLNLVDFTTEWYKQWFELVKIVLGFLLVNVLWERFREEAAREKEQSDYSFVQAQWREQCQTTHTTLTALLSNIKNGTWREHEAARTALAESQIILRHLSQASVKLDAGRAQINRIQQLIYEYAQTRAAQLEKALALTKDEVIPGRHISDEHRALLDELMRYFQQVIDSPSSVGGPG